MTVLSFPWQGTERVHAYRQCQPTAMMNSQGQGVLCQALLPAKGLQGPHPQACAASQHWQSRSVQKAVG